MKKQGNGSVTSRDIESRLSIIRLRTKVGELEAENQALRKKVQMFEQAAESKSTRGLNAPELDCLYPGKEGNNGRLKTG